MILSSFLFRKIKELKNKTLQVLNKSLFGHMNTIVALRFAMNRIDPIMSDLREACYFEYQHEIIIRDAYGQ